MLEVLENLGGVLAVMVIVIVLASVPVVVFEVSVLGTVFAASGRLVRSWKHTYVVVMAARGFRKFANHEVLPSWGLVSWKRA